MESKIEKTRENYCDVLEQCGIGWHENENDPSSFIKYLPGIVLSLSKASVENSLTQLMKDGGVDRHGKRKATFYTRADV